MAIWDRACLDLHHSQDNANIYLRMLCFGYSTPRSHPKPVETSLSTHTKRDPCTAELVAYEFSKHPISRGKARKRPAPRFRSAPRFCVKRGWRTRARCICSTRPDGSRDHAGFRFRSTQFDIRQRPSQQYPQQHPPRQCPSSRPQRYDGSSSFWHPSPPDSTQHHL